MPGNGTPSDSSARWQALEFSLVVVMLGVLGLLVTIVLFARFEPQLPDNAVVTPKDLLVLLRTS